MSEEQSERATSRAIASGGQLIMLTIEAPNGKTVKVETTPTDSFLDIRQFLLDCPETCDVTCYHFEYDGEPANDYSEIQEISELVQNGKGTLKMVHDFYDERLARLHIRRVRELMVHPPVNVQHVSHVNAAVEAKLEKKRAKLEAKIAASIAPAAATPATPAAPVAATALDSTSSSLSLHGYHAGRLDGKKRATDPLPSCVRSITLSAWNPPPGNRQLRGDLLYLEVETLEQQQLTITASVEGFFVNQSTSASFDPSESTAYARSHSLIELLKKLSPSFSARFGMLLTRKIVAHPWESLEVQRPATEWLLEPKAHSQDWNRAEDAMLTTHGMDTRGVLRDWNEEYVCCRELPKTTLHERMLRDRTLHRVYVDFVDAATKGACAIVQGNITPINPMDDRRVHVFIYNNIFFNFAIDNRDTYAKCGGDRTAHSLANLEALGAHLISSLDLPELYTLATTVIDYRGHRLVAQSIIPGVFQGDKATTHAYGSTEPGKPIVIKPEFETLLAKAAHKLNLKIHQVKDVADNVVSLPLSADTKGIIGSDGRNYVLDFFRVTPRDANFPDPQTHPTAVLRPELVRSYVRFLTTEQIAAIRAKKEEAAKVKEAKEQKDKAAAAAAAEAAAAAGEEPASPEVEVSEAEAKALASQEQEAAEEEDPDVIKIMREYSFNPDAYTAHTLVGVAKQIETDTQDVAKAAKFLVDVVVPNFVKSVRLSQIAVTDSKMLTQAMHEKGINMRYLSKVAALAKEANLHFLEQLCVEEMVLRAAKVLLNQALKSVKPDRRQTAEHWFLAPSIARFLNSFLGRHCGGQHLSDDQLSTAASQLAAVDSKTSAKSKKGKRPAVDPFSPGCLWQTIRSLVKDKFNHQLPLRVSWDSRRRVCLLRAFCLKTGVQLTCRDFDFSSETASPFALDDIAGLTPVVKAYYPQSKLVRRMLDDAHFAQQRASVVTSLQSRFLLEQYAYQAFNEALAHLTSITGCVELEAGYVYSNIASSAAACGEAALAAEFQTRALIVFSKTLGIDHPETAFAHAELAGLLLLAAPAGDPKNPAETRKVAEEMGRRAVDHAKRAVYLLEIAAGPVHPDTAAAHLNLSSTYRAREKWIEAEHHVSIALEQFEATLGAEHALVGRAARAKADILLANTLLKINLHVDPAVISTQMVEALKATYELSQKAKKSYAAHFGGQDLSTLREDAFSKQLLSILTMAAKATDLSKLSRVMDLMGRAILTRPFFVTMPSFKRSYDAASHLFSGLEVDADTLEEAQAAGLLKPTAAAAPEAAVESAEPSAQATTTTTPADAPKSKKDKRKKKKKGGH